MVRHFKKDLKLGLDSECDVIKLIKLNWADEIGIKNTKELYGEFCIFDFESESKCSWENKTRRCGKCQYDTTIIQVAKVRSVDTPQYFTFNFLDKFCYIKYDKDVFDKFNTSMIRTYREGKNDFPTRHFLIPIGLLIDLKKE